jgi:hypothetical protein
LQQQALTLRSQKASKLATLQQASSGAEKLRSLLRCNKQAPEPDKLLQRSKLQNQTSSGVCCVAAASSHALELAVATQQAFMLWSLLQRSKQALEFVAL